MYANDISTVFVKENNSAKLFQPFPKQQILDSSELKQFADDNSKFDENLRRFPKWVENTVGKEDIARY